jgi:hypothetical protein
MKEHVKMLKLTILSLIASLLLCPFPLSATAADGVSVYFDESVVNAIQGDSGVRFMMRLVNGGSAPIDGISAEIVQTVGFSNGRQLSGASSVPAGGEETYLFSFDIDDNANYGNHYLNVTFHYSDGSGKKELTKDALVNIGRNIIPSTEFNVPLLDMSYKLEGGDSLKADGTTTVDITVTNRGNVMLQDVQISLALPDIMSLDNSLAVQYAGYLGVGESRTVKFPIYVDKKAENRNYSISVKTSGLSKGAPAAFDRAIYLPVTGGEEKTSGNDIEISNISLPAETGAGDEFTMTFSVGNIGKSVAEDLRIEVTPEEGVVNKTKNVFIEAEMKAGESKNYSVTFFSDKTEAKRKSYQIRISATVGAGEGAAFASQYAGIFLNRDASAGDIKNPQLIVDNYSYGREYVKAGENFNLTLSLNNTGSRDIMNIKVSLSAESGAFVPVGSSNSFFIEQMVSKESVSKSLTMAANPNAEQMTTALNVAMTYEDGEGGVFQAADVISIPVIQETSLTIDDVIAPPELYPGMQSGLDVRFYNTGKTQLRNLRVTAEGNFDTTESTSYYAGNMASGANDRYSFSFIPREEGSLDGKLIFTYDDPSGNKQTLEKEFSFPVLAPMQMDDPSLQGDMPEEPKSRTPLYIGIFAAVAAIAALIALRRFLKRRKLHREMEIDEQL